MNQPLPNAENQAIEPPGSLDTETKAVSQTPIRDGFYRLVPAFDSLRSYSWPALRKDSLAGLTVAAVAIPQAMAYATIAGLDPQYGLYTAIVMTTIGALLDSSRQLINGPTNAISIAVASALALVPSENKIESAILLALLVGVAQTGITLFRLGDLTRYISHAVIVGFTLGAAMLLVFDQFKNLVGLVDQREAGVHFLVGFWRTLFFGGPLNTWATGIGLGTILLVVGIRRLNQHLPIQLPDLLPAVVVMALVVWLGKMDAADKLGEKLVLGAIPPALPAFDLPGIDWVHLRDLAPSALAIALLGLLEAIAMAKAIAAKTGQKLDINQQCLSEGLANLTGSFFQCYPGSGSLTRSAINQQAGAVSQWSGVFSAIAIAITVLLLAPLAHYIPRAALAGILMVSAYRLVDRHQLIYHLRTTRFDAGIVLATALSAVIVSVEFCILIGVMLSFFLYVPRAAHLLLTEFTLTRERVLRERLPADAPCTRILIFSLEGELFFGSAPDLEKHLAAISRRAGDGIRVVVLRLKRVRNPDAVCLRLFEEFLTQMQSRQIAVLMCGVRRDLAKVFRKSGLQDHLGSHRIYHETVGSSSTLDAVRQAYEMLAGDLCPTCPRRGEAGPEKEVLYYMI